MKNIIRIITGLSLLLIVTGSDAMSEPGNSLSISADNKYVSRIVKKQEMLDCMSKNTILPSSIFNRIELEEKDVKEGVKKGGEIK